MKALWLAGNGKLPGGWGASSRETRCDGEPIAVWSAREGWLWPGRLPVGLDTPARGGGSGGGGEFGGLVETELPEEGDSFVDGAFAE